MLAWFSRLPMTARLPLTAALMIFVVAVATTQLAIRRMAEPIESGLVRLGQVYLDGLSAALVPALIDGDPQRVHEALQRSLAIHVGVLDRRLALITADGRQFRVDRPGIVAVPLPEAVATQQSGHEIDATDRSIWIWRPLAPSSAIAAAASGSIPADRATTLRPAATVVANLDASDSLGRLPTLRWSLLGIDLLLSGLCAWIGYLIVRRQQQPLALLADHLGAAGGKLPIAIADDRIPPNDPAVAALIRAYNRMAHDAGRRDEMLNRMADQEREAVLGRMAATLAHEVRNPLAGVLTGIRTLRKFGDAAEVREEALGFMERGVAAMQQVVDATLATHRGPSTSTGFGPDDLNDIQRLIQPKAAERAVLVTIDSQLHGPVQIAGAELRHVLLNLLLNAVAASGPGDAVTLRATLEASQLRIDVIDHGRGIEPERAAILEGRASSEGSRGLGVSVVVRLMARLHGRIRVDARSGQGTHIILTMPISTDEAFTP